MIWVLLAGFAVTIVVIFIVGGEIIDRIEGLGRRIVARLDRKEQ